MNLTDDIILIDKPEGWTSFDVVAKIRGKIRAEYTAKGEKPTKRQLRVGHAGTLDPFATGLVIILVGEACKQAGEFLKLDKTYEFTAKLGEVSTTGDPEGVVTPFVANSKKQIANSANRAVIPGLIGSFDSEALSASTLRLEEDPVDTSEQSESSVKDPKMNAIVGRSEPSVELDVTDVITLTIPTEKDVKTALKQFEGVISQVPPAFSAIKINGQRAYKLAREGKEVVIPPRNVTIHKIELVEYNFPYLKCVCDVSSGTYIRTLVQDIGETLKKGAYCTQLRRTRISTYLIDDARGVEKV